MNPRDCGPQMGRCREMTTVERIDYRIEEAAKRIAELVALKQMIANNPNGEEIAKKAEWLLSR